MVQVTVEENWNFRPRLTWCLVTVTRDRPRSFQVVQEAVSRFTEYPDSWYIVNDGSKPYNFGSDNQVITPRRPVKGEVHSMCSNWLALPPIEEDVVVVQEDDDIWHPDAVPLLLEALKSHILVGFAPAYYYDVRRRGFRVLGNSGHCSLGCTAFRTPLLPWVLDLARKGSPFIDRKLWRRVGAETRKILPNSRPYHVGLKGGSELGNIGNGNRMRVEPDRNYKTLKKWLGDEMAEVVIRAKL